jgi:hypothetical protein
VACPGYQTEGNEPAQNAVDRHAGDLGQLAADLAIKLLSRRMVAALHDRFINGPALCRNRQAFIVMGREEAVHLLFLLRRVQNRG